MEICQSPRRAYFCCGATLITRRQSTATVVNRKQCPPPLLPVTSLALLPRRTHHSHGAGKCVCPDVEIHYEKDTREDPPMVTNSSIQIGFMAETIISSPSAPWPFGSTHTSCHCHCAFLISSLHRPMQDDFPFVIVITS